MTLHITPIDYDPVNKFVESAVIELGSGPFNAEVGSSSFDLELGGTDFDMTVSGALEIEGEDSGIILT